ncbi:LptF/LptG family permease, partial [Escherichia coli]|uniref:LptF/LptG family permease n=1 Tax=Escherichia coli TaxID=562 RepID=UPI0019538690
RGKSSIALAMGSVLGFYVALLLAYGRLYAESEMTVLRACGYGPRQLLKHNFAMATVVLELE